MARRWIGTVVAGLAVAHLAGAASAADVTLDGVVLPGATSSMDLEREVTEFREIGMCPRLLTGCTSARVCVTAPGPVAALDGQLAAAAPVQFAVGVEDGRTFASCVLASLEAEGTKKKRRYEYCLRCEGVLGP